MHFSIVVLISLLQIFPSTKLPLVNSMRFKYIWGPIVPAHIAEYFGHMRELGECLCFAPGSGGDLNISNESSWDDIQRQLPRGWTPDFCLLNLNWSTIPPVFWKSSVPIIAATGDWQVHWHDYQRRLSLCDWALSDPRGVEAFRKTGMTHLSASSLYGFGDSYAGPNERATERDIDVLFIGSLHPSQEVERLARLRHLAQWADRWNIQVLTRVYGSEYRNLMRRAKIVFNDSCRGECNLRVFETIATGALLFQDDSNQEIHLFLEEGREFVSYNMANLESRLAHYLTYNDERERIAAAAHSRRSEFRFEVLWENAIQRIRECWPIISMRCRTRLQNHTTLDLPSRTWQAMNSSFMGDRELVNSFREGCEDRSEDSEFWTSYGLALGRSLQLQRRFALPAMQEVSRCFEKAFQLDPQNWIAALNWAETLRASGSPLKGAEIAMQTLRRMDGDPDMSDSCRLAGRLTNGYDLFRMEWEQIGWQNAGNEKEEIRQKRILICWRLNLLHGQILHDVASLEQAVRLRPDLWSSQMELGMTLFNHGRFTEAIPPLKETLRRSPYHALAARLLFSALGKIGNTTEQRLLTEERRRLKKASPQLVDVEL